MEASITFRFPSLSVDKTEKGTQVAFSGTSVEPSDEELMRQTSRGVKNALGDLFYRYAAIVRGIAYRVLHDVSEANDLVQEIFLLVHCQSKTFDDSKGSARFWILQMAHRRAISRRRYLNSRHFYRQVNLDDAASHLIDPRTLPCQLDEAIDRKLENGRLRKVFACLSKDQRTTLELFFVEGYTLDEIAAKSGQSRGNIKHHYFRGLEKLRKELFGGKLTVQRTI